MRILNEKPSITARLSSALESNGQFSINDEDRTRISAVLEKIARSLWPMKPQKLPHAQQLLFISQQFQDLCLINSKPS